MQIHVVRLASVTQYLERDAAIVAHNEMSDALIASSVNVIPTDINPADEVEGLSRLQVIDSQDEIQIVTDSELVSLVTNRVKFEHINTRDMSPDTAIKSQGSYMAAARETI